MAYGKSKPFRCNTYRKHGGEGGPCLTASALCLRVSVANPLVPLQGKAFGATIRKGTGFLHDPRKQLRSPRCLRLVSGHRELSTNVPGRKSCLGPAFYTLERYNGPQQGDSLSKHTARMLGKCRVGKAGSVRLG